MELGRPGVGSVFIPLLHKEVRDDLTDELNLRRGMNDMKVKSLPGPDMGIFLACLKISIEFLRSFNDQ